jgi:hypothetical protein
VKNTSKADNIARPATYHFYNLGCPKNLVDAERTAARLEVAGWSEVVDPAGAGLLVVTTCAFIEAAEEESVEQILEIAAAKEDWQHDSVYKGRTGQPPAGRDSGRGFPSRQVWSQGTDRNRTGYDRLGHRHGKR